MKVRKVITKPKGGWIIALIEMNLEEEEKKVTELLKGKVVKNIKQYNENEIIIRFEDDTEFFIFCQNDQMNLSIADTFKTDKQ